MRIRHLRIRGQYTNKGWLYTLSEYADIRGSGYSFGESPSVKISKRTARALVGWFDVDREDNWEAHITVTYA
jgi:hypothetical protein